MERAALNARWAEGEEGEANHDVWDRFINLLQKQEKSNSTAIERIHSYCSDMSLGLDRVMGDMLRPLGGGI
jgi:hypothetical protein